MQVYTLVCQIGETTNSLGVFEHLDKACRHIADNFLMAILTCGAAEYGEESETVRIFEKLRDNLGRIDLTMRKAPGVDEAEYWIDASLADGDVEIQRALFTITEHKLDRGHGANPFDNKEGHFKRHHKTN